MTHHLKTHLLTGTVLALAIMQGAAAAELPSYERASFPVTPVQVSVLGSAGVEQAPPAATLTRDGMPATPLQLSVLTPRNRRSASADTATTVGAARN